MGIFANQTTGLSAAHLSSAINIALLKKIYSLKKEKNSKLVNHIKNKTLHKFSLIKDLKILNMEYKLLNLKILLLNINLIN